VGCLAAAPAFRFLSGLAFRAPPFPTSGGVVMVADGVLAAARVDAVRGRRLVVSRSAFLVEVVGLVGCFFIIFLVGVGGPRPVRHDVWLVRARDTVDRYR
jgi:hypothetical protein